MICTGHQTSDTQAQDHHGNFFPTLNNSCYKISRADPMSLMDCGRSVIDILHYKNSILSFIMNIHAVWGSRKEIFFTIRFRFGEFLFFCFRVEFVISLWFVL